MSRWYEVTVKTFKTVLVEVEDSEDDGEAFARHFAKEMSSSFYGDAEVRECLELKSESALADVLQSADEVYPI